MPSFQLGYFTQSLEADHNYHGFQLTVQIPIDKRIENTNVQQLKVQQNQIQNENQAKINELNLKTSQLKSSIHQLENIIERYAQNMSSSQDRLLEKVKQKYTNGEINFLEFSQIQRRIFQNQNEYLDHTQVYNEKVILLNYLSILN
nr:TolC family protein [Membranihabitans maritimus]